MSFDPTTALLDEWYSQPPGDNAACKRQRCEPTPEQNRLIHQTIATARRVLTLPDRFLVRCVVGEDGSAHREPDGTYVMALGVETWPHKLQRCVFHEARHLADYVAGVNLQATRAEMEHRAYGFENDMMRLVTLRDEAGIERLAAVERIFHRTWTRIATPTPTTRERKPPIPRRRCPNCRVEMRFFRQQQSYLTGENVYVFVCNQHGRYEFSEDQLRQAV